MFFDIYFRFYIFSQKNAHRIGMRLDILRFCCIMQINKLRFCTFYGEIKLRRRFPMFKRKIYDKLIEWKNESEGKTALMIEGARRVGKSTVAEEFAKNEYESYILIDFSSASNAERLI